jgi:hypothetical protein
MANLISGSLEQEINQGACFVILEGSSNSADIATVIPCYPDGVAESQSAQWSEQAIIGRSSPISSYNNTSYRTIDVTLKLHRELGEQMGLGTDCLERLEIIFRRSVYPSYNNQQGISPPITTIVLGNFKAKGYVTSVTFNWSGPIIDKKYQMLEIGVHLTDTAGGNKKVLGIGDVMPGSMAKGQAQVYTENPFAYSAYWNGSGAYNYKTY